jgi:hypothetical protein
MTQPQTYTTQPAWQDDELAEEDGCRLTLEDFAWLQSNMPGIAWVCERPGRLTVRSAKPERRTRKPSIARTIKQAERAGKKVTSVTMPDGATLRFDEPTPDTANEWDKALSRGKH